MAQSTLQRRAFWLCLALFTVAAVFIAGRASRIDWLVEREIWLIRSSGTLATLFLLASLSVSPLRRIVRMRQSTARSYRRALGMTAAWVAFGHLSMALLFTIAPAWEALIRRAHYRSGLVAAIILGILLLTSFPTVLKVARIKLWNELHRLAYVAAALVAHHVLLSSYAARGWVLVGISIAGLGLLVRFFPARKT